MFVHPLNAEFPRNVTESGRWILVIPEQLLKAYPPILVRPDGKYMLVRPVQF